MIIETIASFLVAHADLINGVFGYVIGGFAVAVFYVCRLNRVF